MVGPWCGHDGRQPGRQAPGARDHRQSPGGLQGARPVAKDRSPQV